MGRYGPAAYTEDRSGDLLANALSQGIQSFVQTRRQKQQDHAGEQERTRQHTREDLQDAINLDEHGYSRGTAPSTAPSRGFVESRPVAGTPYDEHPMFSSSALADAFRTSPTQETTAIPDARQREFDSWLQRNRITDLNNPDAHYDYRGAFLSGVNRDGASGHWPDTFKQHGHPTFSVESRYSSGPRDGGHWDGDSFSPPQSDNLSEAFRGTGMPARTAPGPSIAPPSSPAEMAPTHPGAFNPMTGTFGTPPGVAAASAQSRYSQVTPDVYRDETRTPEGRRRSEQEYGRSLEAQMAEQDRQRKVEAYVAAGVPREKAMLYVVNPGLAENDASIGKAPPPRNIDPLSTEGLRAGAQRDSTQSNLTLNRDLALERWKHDHPTAAQGQPSEGERKNAVSLALAENAAPFVDKYAQTIASSVLGRVPVVGNALLGRYNKDYQLAKQSANQFAEGYLRMVSGATITPQEIDKTVGIFFPQPGDSPEVLARKKSAQETMLRGMRVAAGRAALPSAGSVDGAPSPTFDGTTTTPKKKLGQKTGAATPSDADAILAKYGIK